MRRTTRATSSTTLMTPPRLSTTHRRCKPLRAWVCSGCWRRSRHERLRRCRRFAGDVHDSETTRDGRMRPSLLLWTGFRSLSSWHCSAGRGSVGSAHFAGRSSTGGAAEPDRLRRRLGRQRMIRGSEVSGAAATGPRVSRSLAGGGACLVRVDGGTASRSISEGDLALRNRSARSRSRSKRRWTTSKVRVASSRDR